MKQLTKSEKISLLVGKDGWHSESCNDKLYAFSVTDGPLGVRQVNEKGVVEPSITYPSAQLLAFTWEPTLAKEMGKAIADDCIDRNLDVLLAPGVNIKRIPICGRNFEYFSEDPLISGIMGREYIYGVQEENVGTSLKHFCCNNMESSRNYISSDVDERTLREIYMRPFEIACEAQPWTVMCAYNGVNGVPMAKNEKLFKVLREKFGFTGLIMSDWDAVKDSAESISAGIDIIMPYRPHYVERLNEAVENNTIDTKGVERAVENITALSQKCEKASKLRKASLSVKEREEISQKIAEEGIVLLKNNGVLPLKKEEKIFAAGTPTALYYFGGGSAAVPLRNEYLPVYPIHEILKNYGHEVRWHETLVIIPGERRMITNVKGAVRVAQWADVSIVCVGNRHTEETESIDRQHIKLSREETDIIKYIAKNSKKTVVLVYAGSAIDMRDWIDEVDAVVWAGYGGEFGNFALAKILTGEVNPSGRLTETFPLDLYDVPAMNTYRDEACVVYSEGLNVGYRYFNTYQKEVLFPFGYGLSYSKFAYSNLKIKGAGTSITLSFEIENLSDMDGKEVAQIYVKELCKEVYRPNKELKAFKKVLVKAREKVNVEIPLDRSAFAYYSVAKDKWTVCNGFFEIQVCSNVEQVELSEVVEINE